MLAGGASLSWLANPFLILAWLCLAKSYRNTWLFALMATLLSILFTGFKTIIQDEAGHETLITMLGTGYWLWVTSCTTALVGSITARLMAVKSN